MVAGGGLLLDRLRFPASAPDDVARFHERTFRVSRVIDGDTLDLAVPDGQRPHTRVRLWGVDAPEKAHGEQPGQWYAAEATAFAERILSGRDVLIVLWPERTRGKYGRLLAYVYLERGGSSFNEMLIEEGFAYNDPRFAHPLKERFRRVEKQARRDQVGLWAAVTLDDMPVWRQRFEKRD